VSRPVLDILTIHADPDAAVTVYRAAMVTPSSTPLSPVAAAVVAVGALLLAVGRRRALRCFGVGFQ
jgi:hypothetical protein